MARLCLQHVPHICAHPVSQTWGIAQTALSGGANDMGVVVCEPASVGAAVAEVERHIRMAGYLPQLRDASHHIVAVELSPPDPVGRPVRRLPRPAP
jgi:2-iminoacetate synthase ThiH